MPLPLHLPDQIGYAALLELDNVQWRSLEHAYGTGVERDARHGDVAASLRELGDPNRAAEAIHSLYGNIYHQGTVYEASAYAVPFLAAVAAGDEVSSTARLELIVLLGSIVHAASRATDDGSRAGAFGEGVDELIHSALEQCVSRLGAVSSLDPKTADVVHALNAITTAASTAGYRALQDALSAVASELLARRENGEAKPIKQTDSERFRHAKFGDAELVRRMENGLLLRFDDGKERVILERFVTKLTP